MEQRCFWGRLCHRAPCSCSHNMLGAIQACAQARLYKSCCQIEQRLSSQLAVRAVICAAAMLTFLPPTHHQLALGPPYSLSSDTAATTSTSGAAAAAEAEAWARQARRSLKVSWDPNVRDYTSEQIRKALGVHGVVEDVVLKDR